MDQEVNELKEVLDVVSEKVPKLLKDLVGTLFSPEAGKNAGAAVGSYYKALVEAGIPADQALAMAQQYASLPTKIMNSGMMGDLKMGSGRDADQEADEADDEEADA